MIVAVLLVAGCGKPDACRALLDEMVKKVVTVTAQSEPARLRYNPAGCDCPPFELRVEDRWVRVELVESEDPARPLPDFIAQCKAEAASLASYEVGLSLDSSTPVRCPNGTWYFSVVLGPVPEPALPDEQE